MAGLSGLLPGASIWSSLSWILKPLGMLAAGLLALTGSYLIGHWLGHDAGYAAREKLSIAAIKDANAKIAQLNFQLSQEEDKARAAADTAIQAVGASGCKITPALAEKLNKIH